MVCAIRVPLYVLLQNTRNSLPCKIEAKQGKMVQSAVDCLSHTRRELARSRFVSARARSNAATLSRLADELVANMVETLWNLQWSRHITARLNRINGYVSPDQIARVQQIEERDLRRIQHSFDAMLGLASKLAELGTRFRKAKRTRHSACAFACSRRRGT